MQSIVTIFHFRLEDEIQIWETEWHFEIVHSLHLDVTNDTRVTLPNQVSRLVLKAWERRS